MGIFDKRKVDAFEETADKPFKTFESVSKCARYFGMTSQAVTRTCINKGTTKSKKFDGKKYKLRYNET